MPRYIYPPRPKSKIKPSQLPDFEKQGKHLWQPKFDGDRCVSAIHDGRVYLSNRHGKWHSQNSFPAIRRDLLALKLPECCLDGELIKHEGEPVLVLFDVLFWKKYLIGSSQIDRLSLLDALDGESHSSLPVRCIGDHLWVVDHGDTDFSETFKRFIEHPLLEGLVLRRKDSKLANWGGSEYEVDWQIRCRRPSKNYRF